MSAPTADPRPGGASAGLLVGVALGLMLLAALAALLLLGSGKPIDGRAHMIAVFGAAELPFGLEVTSATRTPTGETIVVHEVRGAPAEPAVATSKESQPAEASSNSSGAPRIDWSALPIPDASGPPRQAAFLFVPPERGRAVIDDMVRNLRGRDRSELMDGGGTVVLARGKLEHAGYDAEWVHLRAYERGPTFRDAMRISLSTPDAPCILTATWTRGVPGSLAVLDELTRSLRSAHR